MRDVRVKEKYNIFLPLTHIQWGTMTFKTSECIERFPLQKLSSAPSSTCGSGSAIGYGGTFLHGSILEFSQNRCLPLSQLVAPRSLSYTSVLLILFAFPPASLPMGSQPQFLHQIPISTSNFHLVSILSHLARCQGTAAKPGHSWGLLQQYETPRLQSNSTCF